jgi:hypothetical protein
MRVKSEKPKSRKPRPRVPVLPVCNIENARCLVESIGVSKTNQINESLSLANIYAMKDEKIEEE